MRIVTMGVYGYTAGEFREALANADVDIFVDTRRRRGVRGSQYSFANSARLQQTLADLGIPYIHRLDLAPTMEMVHAQDATDRQAKILRHERKVISPALRSAYEHDILEGFDSHAFIASLGDNITSLLIFCIEEVPEACHRSLLAKRLQDDLGGTVVNLVPVDPDEDAHLD